jgi:hypothetical protein
MADESTLGDGPELSQLRATRRYLDLLPLSWPARWQAIELDRRLWERGMEAEQDGGDAQLRSILHRCKSVGVDGAQREFRLSEDLQACSLGKAGDDFVESATRLLTEALELLNAQWCSWLEKDVRRVIDQLASLDNHSDVEYKILTVVLAYACGSHQQLAVLLDYLSRYFPADTIDIVLVGRSAIAERDLELLAKFGAGLEAAAGELLRAKPKVTLSTPYLSLVREVAGHLSAFALAALGRGVQIAFEDFTLVLRSRDSGIRGIEPSGDIGRLIGTVWAVWIRSGSDPWLLPSLVALASEAVQLSDAGSEHFLATRLSLAAFVFDAVETGRLPAFKLNDALACADEVLRQTPDNLQILILKGALHHAHVMTRLLKIDSPRV